jgi:hypothetical protein
MRFSALEQVALPCVFEQLIAGRLHADGRRYLPLIVLRVPRMHGDTERATLIGVVDRHHRVDPGLAGSAGVARLVFLLSTVRVQTSSRIGLFPEPVADPSRISTVPLAFGRVTAVPAWETESAHLPYQSLYTELVLDIGIGTIGVRTSATATSLADMIGKSRIEPGDWLEVERSRVDILAFEPH